MDQQSDENVVVTETESAPEEKASAPESEKKPKRAIPKPLLIGAIAAVCVVVLLVIIIASAGAYKTPLRTMQKYENAETVACEKLTSDMLNGIDGGYLTKAVKLLKKSKIDTKIEKIEKNYEDAMSEARDDYGANYRISFRSIDSLELEKEDLWNYRNNIRSLGKTLYTSGHARS